MVLTGAAPLHQQKRRARFLCGLTRGRHQLSHCFFLPQYWQRISLHYLNTRRLDFLDHILDELQAGIKIAKRNINNLGYADDTTLTEESVVELKSLLMRMKESEKKLT